MTRYTVDYFIKKFEAIPRKNWFTCGFVNPNNSQQRCALGHCGYRVGGITTEGLALEDIFKTGVTGCNDGTGLLHYPGKHPRTRILRALRKIKKERGK